MKKIEIKAGDKLTAKIAMTSTYKKHHDFVEKKFKVESISINEFDVNQYNCIEENGDRFSFSESKINSGGVLFT